MHQIPLFNISWYVLVESTCIPNTKYMKFPFSYLHATADGYMNNFRNKSVYQYIKKMVLDVLFMSTNGYNIWVLRVASACQREGRTRQREGGAIKQSVGGIVVLSKFRCQKLDFSSFYYARQMKSKQQSINRFR